MPIITPTSNKTIHDNNFVKLSAITNCNLNSNYVKLATSTSITLPLETNVIETVTLAEGDYVLFKSQTTLSENGLTNVTP